MAVRTKDEIMGLIRGRLGEDMSDEAIALIEDVDDTFSAMESTENENWRQRYEDNDKAWRAKYRERFFSKPVQDEADEVDTPAPKATRFEDLFKEV